MLLPPKWYLNGSFFLNVCLQHMPFIILFAGIILLVLLITWVKLNPFIAFIIVSVLVGLANGMEISATTASIQKGIGELMGSIVVILGFGAMLGKLVAESGAAQKMADVIMKAFGRKYLLWALVLTAFIVGIPLFYGVGFVLMMPLIITVSGRYNIPAVYIGLPMLSALSVTHGYLPPHPSPVALVAQFNADLGLTLLYGLIVCIPVIILAGPVFATTLKGYKNKPLDIFNTEKIPDDQLPSFFDSIFTAFLPVLLIALSTITGFITQEKNTVTAIIAALGDPIIAMTLTLLYALWSLGLKRGKTITQLMKPLTDAVKDIAMILLIIGGAGALKQILIDCGISGQIAEYLHNLNMNPLWAAWIIASIIRICLGSATVSGLTAAGIVAPLVTATGADPNLMVLATGAGSLMFSHVNDPGFWMYKEYFNISIKDSIKTWSVMETIVSVAGIVFIYLLSFLI